MAVQKSKKVTKIKLTIMPKAYAHLETMTKGPAKLQIDRYKSWSCAHKVPTVMHFNSTLYLSPQNVYVQK